jgi:hypothetical protein
MTMLDISVTIEGDKITVAGLNEIASRIPNAVKRGLERSAQGIHRAAYEFLSGAGAKKSNRASGGYPVPVRTGFLRHVLDWLNPGASKSSSMGTFTAGADEVVIYNSAEYAGVIHDGRGSSATLGPRRFLTDALVKFNSNDQIKRAIEEEIEKEISRAGLK